MATVRDEVSLPLIYTILVKSASTEFVSAKLETSQTPQMSFVPKCSETLSVQLIVYDVESPKVYGNDSDMES